MRSRVDGECGDQVVGGQRKICAAVRAHGIPHAIQLARKAGKRRRRVRGVIGGGPIGLTSGIISRILGAGDVVFTEPSEARLAALVHHGFDSFDPRHNTCLSDLLTRAEGHGYDVVIETSGTPSGMECAIQAARPRGRVVVVGFPKYETAPYNQTRTIVKELTIIGSRVYPLEEFKATVRLLEEAVRNKSVDFSCIISDIRGLEDLQRSLQDIARGETNGKILIKPN